MGGARRSERSFSIELHRLGPEMWPLYGVEGWPHIRGFVSTVLYGNAFGTKVSSRHREGGRLSGVAVKRGSTVLIFKVVTGAMHRKWLTQGPHNTCT